ncbi:CHAT domain-containing protein [Luteibacter sp. OK325]|uniref:CHAT domain-containing protein n=1 Tax=Luteibacter sp. OK325 TaxID=2135670 RepID=UPI000D34E575|nr:CHAT domain-containing protein [Luteibacter sp. OK325]PTR33977.1 CHAT domain-containing protein [Luteibacter sp. OK325]
MPTHKKHLDFDLRLSVEGDRYFAKVSNSPAGESEKSQISLQFGSESLEALRLRLADAVRRRSGSGVSPASKEESLLREFGDQIFRAIFRNTFAVATKFEASLGIVRERSDELEGLRVKLHVDSPELALLPWEFMFDKAMGHEDAYLCLNNRSPIVRFLDIEGPPTRLPVDGPVRILGMVSNPCAAEWPDLDVEAERTRIDMALKDLPAGSVELKWVHGGSTDRLFDMMQEGPWHIFHFIGHGGVDEYTDEQGQQRTRGFVLMQDGDGKPVKVYGSGLGGMLQADGSLQLAILNCCEGARGAISSAGASLVSWGLPMVIAMQFPITDGASARFAERFYRSLSMGETVEHALTTARQGMLCAGGMEWGIPVLFSRSGSSVVFQAGVRKTPVTPITVTPPASMSTLPTYAVAPVVNLKAQDEFRKMLSRRSGAR